MSNNHQSYREKVINFKWVLQNIEMAVLIPAAVILNLVLFIVIIRNEKHRTAPWRCLIAHTAFCYFLLALLMFINNFTWVYDLPSLMTTPLALCAAVTFVYNVLRVIGNVSAVLLAIERYRALKIGDGNGGMGKIGVIVSLSLFWVLAIVMYLIIALKPNTNGRSSFEIMLVSPYHDSKVCYMNPYIFIEFGKMILHLFYAVSIITVIIGTTILACRESTASELKKSVATPTIVFTTLFLILVVPAEITFNLQNILFILYLGELLDVIFHLFVILFWLSFPIVWLVTWSRNGDILLRTQQAPDVV